MRCPLFFSLTIALGCSFAQESESPFSLEPYKVQNGYVAQFPRSSNYFEGYFENFGIKNKIKENEIRFLWVRSFHPAILFEIKTTNSEGFLFTASEWVGEYGSRKWKVFSEKTIGAEAHLIMLKEIKNHFVFFDMEPFIKREGLDGSDWIIEVQFEGMHHQVYRWSPTKDTPFFSLGLDFIELSIDSPVTPIY